MFGIGSLDYQLKLMSGNIVNMILFDKIKTGNSILDTFITTLLLTGVTYLFHFINNNLYDLMGKLKNINLDYKSLFYKKMLWNMMEKYLYLQIIMIVN